jgi:hypothetical protein
MNGNITRVQLPEPGPGAFDIEGFARWAGVGRTSVFEEAKAGRLIVSKVGRRSIVTYANAKAWLNALPVRKVA